MKRTFFVSPEEKGGRIDVTISRTFPELSRSHVQKLLKSEAVLVNGQPVKANYKTLEGDCVELNVPEPAELEIQAESMDLDILYEDRDVILINKPKGMVVHPAPGHYSVT